MDDAIQLEDFYTYRKENSEITFARLESGLTLFMDIYEQSKTKLASEMVLWDHRLCYDQIKYGECQIGGCDKVHTPQYRQKNLCEYWYKGNRCKFNDSQCRNSHSFEDESNYPYPLYIRNETDANIYRLIRYLRNSLAHSFDSNIQNKDDQQDLYKQMIVIMAHLVHFLATVTNESDSSEHLNIFLGKITIDQLISEDHLIIQLEKPYAIPKIFFTVNTAEAFETCWYARNEDRICVDFTELSDEFVEFFNSTFMKYHKRRLVSRGREVYWQNKSRKKYMEERRCERKMN